MVKAVRVEHVIEIPEGVELKLDGKKVTIKGKLGSVVNDFSHAKTISIEHKKKEKQIVISADFPKKNEMSTVSTLKFIIHNAFKGVTKGYTYKMKLVYAHFPITVVAPKKGSYDILIKNFIGERGPRMAKSLPGVEVTANKEEVILKGCDKAAVGQTAANIQKATRIRFKDARVFQDGIFVYEKSCGEDSFWKIK